MAAGVVGIHQVVALVVEDGGGAQSALLEEARGGEDEGGLAGPQKSADHRDDGLHRRQLLALGDGRVGRGFLAVDGGCAHRERAVIHAQDSAGGGNAEGSPSGGACSRNSGSRARH